MKIIKKKLADLVLAAENVRMHPKKQIAEYARSLAMFGQTKNAVIDEHNNVLIGNGLVMAARELGWEEIFAIKREGLSENEKLKLMISDNKIFSLGVDNLEILEEVFRKMSDDLDVPGYDEDTLRAIIGETEAITAEITNYGKLSDDEITEINNRTQPTVRPVDASPSSTGHINAEHTGNTEVSQNTDSAGTQKTVQCPKCGEVFGY